MNAIPILTRRSKRVSRRPIRQSTDHVVERWCTRLGYFLPREPAEWDVAKLRAEVNRLKSAINEK